MKFVWFCYSIRLDWEIAAMNNIRINSAHFVWTKFDFIVTARHSVEILSLDRRIPLESWRKRAGAMRPAKR